jgi:hypothetical protein
MPVSWLMPRLARHPAAPRAMHDVAPMQALAAGMAYLASLVHLWRYLSPETAPGLRSRTRGRKNRGKGRVRSLVASVLFLLAGITWTVVAVQTAERNAEEDSAGDLVITSQGAGVVGHQRPDALP